MSNVKCQMSYQCEMSNVMACQMSNVKMSLHVKCQMSNVKFQMLNVKCQMKMSNNKSQYQKSNVKIPM